MSRRLTASAALADRREILVERLDAQRAEMVGLVHELKRPMDMINRIRIMAVKLTSIVPIITLSGSIIASVFALRRQRRAGALAPPVIQPSPRAPSAAPQGNAHPAGPLAALARPGSLLAVVLAGWRVYQAVQVVAPQVRHVARDALQSARVKSEANSRPDTRIIDPSPGGSFASASQSFSPEA